ncbi:MAG: hypothetical protein DCC68_21275 [Planctomycetota bacterium]|nr:MAG: hypothetical protein DCC68_21275 [Planctomycetota bacterium]
MFLSIARITREKTKDEKMKEKTNIVCNAAQRVSPVAPSTAWPPPWAGGEPSPEAVATLPEPSESLPAPCPTCLCAIGWRLPDGRVLCGECHEQPADAVKVVFVDDGRGWVEYADERRQHERRHDEAGELPAWDDGEPWDASTPTCPKCGSAALWESMADKLHCLSCDPPRRAQRLAAKAALIRSRRYKPVFAATECGEET